MKNRSTLLVNPPFLKYNAGPPLGLCLLMQECKEKNLPVEFLDLNLRALKRLAVKTPTQSVSGPIGDHSRLSYDLDYAEEVFSNELSEAYPSVPILQLKKAQLDVDEAIGAKIPHGSGEFDFLFSQSASPAIVAFSVMVSRQVPWVLLAIRKIRQIWPDTKIILGGAYMGALELQAPVFKEMQRAAWLKFADLIVIGHAERTFAGIVAAAAQGEEIPYGVHRGDEKWVPARSNFTLEMASYYGKIFDNPRPMVPIQTSVGCKWGRCAFCTYPVIEPYYRTGNMADILGELITPTSLMDGCLVIKDSYVTAFRLAEIASIVQGRIPWAACTRLSDAARPNTIRIASAGGLHTLEIGLETLDQDESKHLQKAQSQKQLLKACENAQNYGVLLVLNVMWGLPGQSEEKAKNSRQFLKIDLPALFPGLRFHLEENILELERGSQFIKNPAKFGIIPGREWPFAANLEYWHPRWVEKIMKEEKNDQTNHEHNNRICYY